MNNFIIKLDGSLGIVAGGMFSGKSSELIKYHRRMTSIGKRCILFSYSLDHRYTESDQIHTHDNYGIDCRMVRTLDGVGDEIKEYDIVIIDEAQFFPNLKFNVRRFVDDMKKNVIVAGLDGDYKRNTFGQINELIPDCDEYVKLHAMCAICVDGTHANFTWKHTDRNDQNVIDICSDKYIPVCRKHYNEKKKHLLGSESW